MSALTVESLNNIIIAENTAQNIPAMATVVNLGVSFLHLKLTEKTEKPIEDIIPNTNPRIVFSPELSIAIIKIPIAAIAIATQTLFEISSLKNIKPSNAVIKGIAAKHNNVTAAEVFVIE